MPSLAKPRGTTDLAAYFDGLYGALAASSVFARIGCETFGDAFVGQLGCAGEAEFLRLAELAGAGPGRTILDLCSGSGGRPMARRLDMRVAGRGRLLLHRIAPRQSRVRA